MGRNVLIHYGVKGMQWGKDNFRNPDGTLNTAGKRRYGVGNTDRDMLGKPRNSTYS